MSSLQQLTDQTKKLTKKFPGSGWKAETRFVDLVEEIGELANAILVKEKRKSKKRQKSEIADSLCDCLYNILILSDIYKIDLDKEYQQVLKQIELRIKKGEFDDLWV